jgi:transcription-repair coupling factor (superfamily II helicase)
MKEHFALFLKENSLPQSLLKEGKLYKGACFFDEKVIFIGSGDLSLKRAKELKISKKTAFFQPKAGDLVVHDKHGIGLCGGLKKIEIDGQPRDFVVIKYRGGDTLYVAATSMNLLSAYSGEDNPQLSKIGGGEFEKIKQKAKNSIKEMAFDLGLLYAEREELKGHKYSRLTSIVEMENDFPYVETPDQLTAIQDGIEDLEKGKVMDRLLCGDVGYGKTEVAMRIAYKVILEGKQVAFVSPTTVLAKQHYSTLKNRMEKYGVNISPLSRFQTKEQAKEAIKGTENGTTDILCGTHRALSKDIVFKDLGLLVLDEEQKFGVADKEKIKLMKKDVNVLSLSATPIPRTLHMALSGIRDISVLSTPPPSRIPVSTYVSEYTESLVKTAVEREIGRGGQVFIVYNRVETITHYAKSICDLFPHLKVSIAHGQMEKTVLEDTLSDFIDGKIDILITSTIIENGIDMKNVNTMIVVDADRLGLSQLYQLRGRVGRGERLAYIFFTFSGDKILTENAYKRLDAITSYTQFGSGFKLAMRDLEIRGAGNIMGRAQHGHMMKVGYEMYLKLIQEVKSEMLGQTKQAEKDVKIVTDFAALLPESYIPDVQWRLKIYKNISFLETSEEASELIFSLTDIYGKPPKEVQNLVTAALIKNLAAKIGAAKVSLSEKKCGLFFEKNFFLPLNLLQLAIERGFNYSAAENSISVSSKQDAIKRMINFLLEAAKDK